MASRFFATLKTTFERWNEHDAPRLGAALSFYTILSLSPLLVLVVAAAGLIFSRTSAQTHIISEVQGMVGSQGAQAVAAMLANTQKPRAGLFGTIIGLVSLLFGASGVFTELRSALNKIWQVPAEAMASGLMGMLRERFFSFGMVLSIGFLLMVSLVLSTTIAAMGKFFGSFLPLPAPVLATLNFLVSFLGISVLFALIFKFVPAVKVKWNDVWLGSLVTALFFTVGKLLIALYLGKTSVGSPYGAAGSVIVVIVWVYYSAQLFFLGAEFTHASATHHLPEALQSQEKLRDQSHAA